MVKLILSELKSHAPFTAMGALGGITLMLLLRNIPHGVAHEFFYIFHPIHVLLSALTTAAMFRRHTCPVDRKKCDILFLLIVGYVGSVGIATLSDSLMPYLGEALLDMPHRHYHIGFLEKGWLVSVLALTGITLAYVNPTTKFPHSGHVLVSTWASLFHMLMAIGAKAGMGTYAAMFAFLFLAVWLPCCISDIVFPLLFVKGPVQPHRH